MNANERLTTIYLQNETLQKTGELIPLDREQRSVWSGNSGCCLSCY